MKTIENPGFVDNLSEQEFLSLLRLYVQSNAIDGKSRRLTQIVMETALSCLDNPKEVKDVKRYLGRSFSFSECLKLGLDSVYAQVYLRSKQVLHDIKNRQDEACSSAESNIR